MGDCNRIAVLMTCHDRVAVTVGSLKQLFAAAARLEGGACKDGVP